MKGILRQLGPQRWAVEIREPAYTRPAYTTVRWAVQGARRTGPFAPDLADGLVLDSVPGGDTWQAYHQGDYVILTTEHTGTALPEEPIAPPTARRGQETRYRDGRWEVYSDRRGWIPAPAPKPKPAKSGG